MKSKWTLPLIIASALLLASVGCKKAAPETPADPPPPPPTAAPPPPPEVTPPPAPPTEDRTPQPLDGEIVEANRHARQNGLIGDVYFDFDKYDLKDAARAQLSKNASFLGERSEFRITIEGHCDERGTNDYNIALGDRRANSARDFLISAGIDGSRINTISYGEERPTCTQSDDSCWSNNRRAEFHITGRR